MVKIRKKTSKRTSSAMMAKVKRKVSEKHKKDKKAAKKDVTWKSNKPKEIGIPNSFPYKDQLLAEAQAEKIRAEEEKAAKREALRNGTATLASTAALAAALAADSQRAEEDMFDTEDPEDDEEKQVQDASLKLHAKSLRKVLEASDVLIEVLDARDPIGTRCRAVERELKSLDGGRKKLVLVLNKIDLVPPPVVQAWLTHLRLQAPTIPFKSSTQQQRNHLSASSTHAPNSASGSSTKPLMELIKGFRLASAPSQSGSTENRVKQSLTIGLIGHPNVGKSSLINTLKRSKACSVAPTPGWTKEVQEVSLEKGVRVLDCPGVVVEARGEVEGSLRGMVKPEDVRDPKAPVELILKRCKKEHLQMLYNIPAFEGTLGFLLEVAKAKGRLRKGGVPDVDGTARSILRDWVAGRIPYYTSPPAAASTSALQSVTSSAATPLVNVSASDVNSATLLTEFAPAFDLAALFGEADAVAFGEDGEAGVAGAGVTGKGVKMDGFEGESEDANVGWITGEGDEDDDDMEAEDDMADVDDLMDDEDVEDEDAEMDAMDEDVPAPVVPTPKKSLLKTNKRAAPEIVSVAPVGKKAKAVSFSSKPLGPTGSTITANAATLNSKAIMDEAESISLNKSIKKNAKKDKKKANKEKKAIQEVEGEFGEDAEMPSRPRGARTVGGSAVDDAYDFAEFFGPNKGKQVVPMENDYDEEL